MDKQLLKFPKNTISQKKKKKGLVRSFIICLEETAHVNTELMIQFLTLFRATKLLSDEACADQASGPQSCGQLAS